MDRESRYYEKAKARVKEKKEFYQHLSTYVSVGIVLFAVNFFTMGRHGIWWFKFPMFFWGIGLFMHYMSVFGWMGNTRYDEQWEEREIAREVERMKEKEYYYEDKPKAQEQTSPPTEDELELKEFKKLRREWDDSEFV
ncbi:MAG: 2TM domain-containing protein [Bacteroidota bacterium]